MSWVDVKLGEICIDKGIQTGPFGSQLHQCDYSEYGVPVVMPVDLVDGGISTSRIAHVSEEHVARLSRHKLKEGDIVYARRGDVGRCSRVTAKEVGWLCGTGCLKLTYKPSKVDPDFLFYALSNPEVVGWVRNHAVGVTMPNLNTGILESIPLRIPLSLDEQRSIAEKLRTLDDFIDNSRRQIKLLEEAAQRLYREWFVDMRFPGHEDVDFVDGLPEGWAKCRLSDFAEFRRGKVITAKQTKPGTVPVVAGGLTPAYYHDASNTVAPVITVSGSGANAGYTALYGREIWASDCSFLDSEKTDYIYFVFLTVKVLGRGFKHLQRGSAQPHVYPSHINELQFICSSCEALNEFEMLVESMFKKVRVLEAMIEQLREARDRLLPMLMSKEDVV